MTDVNLSNWQEAPHNRWGFSHLSELVPTAVIGTAAARTGSLPRRVSGGLPVDDVLVGSYTDAFVVLHRDEIVHEQYFGDFKPQDRHVLMSVSKSLCGLIVGRLVGRGLLDVTALVSRYVPELANSAYGDATLQQVLDMTVAVEYSEDYLDPQSHVQTQDRVAGWRPRSSGDPADTYEFLATLRKRGEHGSTFAYVSAGTDVLAWVVESVTGQRYSDAVSVELWSQIRPESEAVITVDVGGFAFANGGIACTARDLLKVGELMLRGGELHGEQVIPAAWVADTLRGGDQRLAAGSVFQRIHPRGSYRNQWWVTGDEHGSVYAAGIHGQFVWVDPAHDVVIVKFSSCPEPVTERWSRLHAELFRGVAESLGR